MIVEMLLLVSCAQQPTLKAIPQLRIGGAADDRSALNEIVGAAMGPDGAIYITQFQVPGVTGFGSNGKIVMKVGRSGKGPGEFMGASQLGWKADTLWVRDPSLGRLTLYAKDGRPQSTISHIMDPISDNFLPAAPLALSSTGRVVYKPQPSFFSVQSGLVKKAPILTTSRSGSDVDTIAITTVTTAQIELHFPGGNNARTFHPIPVTPYEAISPTSDALVLVGVPEFVEGSVRFTVTKLLLNGDTVFARQFSVPRVPVSGKQRERMLVEVIDLVKGGMGAPADIVNKVVRKTIVFPPAFPPVSGIVSARDGRIWIRREQSGGASAKWLILKPDGKTFGEMLLPSRVRVVAADGDVFWGQDKDDLDVPILRKYRVVKVSLPR